MSSARRNVKVCPWCGKVRRWCYLSEPSIHPRCLIERARCRMAPPGPMTLREISLILQLSKERVRQLAARALAKLQIAMEDAR